MPQPTRNERRTILDGKRNLKMARSTHAYVRGNTAKFYEWLDASPAAKRVPQGPAIWICGDCHLGNLGPINVAPKLRLSDRKWVQTDLH